MITGTFIQKRFLGDTRVNDNVFTVEGLVVGVYKPFKGKNIGAYLLKMHTKALIEIDRKGPEMLPSTTTLMVKTDRKLPQVGDSLAVSGTLSSYNSKTSFNEVGRDYLDVEIKFAEKPQQPQDGGRKQYSNNDRDTRDNGTNYQRNDRPAYPSKQPYQNQNRQEQSARPAPSNRQQSSNDDIPF